jgi:hypothetical protein
MSWPSWPDPSLPLLFRRGRDHHYRCRRVRCRGAPRRPDDRRSKKVTLVLFFMSPSRPLTLEHRPLPKNRLLPRVFQPRPPRLRLSQHPGAIVSSKSTHQQHSHPHHATIAGVSTRRILPSASTTVSSCAVPPLRLLEDVRLCVEGRAPLLGCRTIRIRAMQLGLDEKLVAR